MSNINHKQLEKNYFIYLKPQFFFEKLNIVYLIALFGFSFFFTIGHYLSHYILPIDFQQGEVYKILYLHVPIAWLSLNIYIFMAIFGLSFLITKHPINIFLIKSLSSIGTFYTLLTLITGILWGKPMWGIWWIWDARLTSMLILFFIYISHFIILNNTTNGSSNTNKISSIYLLVGFLVIPIIKYSVDWWATLHQPSSINSVGSTIHESMLYPLIFMFSVFVFYSIIIFIINLKKNFILNKIDFYKSILF